MAFSLYSLSINSMVASAAAMHTGFPPNVVPCAPGFQRITLSLAMMAPSGMPLAMPFAQQRMSGSIPACSEAHHCRCGHARLHFVHDEHDAVLSADAL